MFEVPFCLVGVVSFMFLVMCISLAAVVRALISEQLQGRPRADSKNPRLAALKGLGEGDAQPVGRHHNEFLYGRKQA